MKHLTSAKSLDRRPVIVATFERSGTHLTIDLIRKNFRECRAWRLPGERLEKAYVNMDRLGAGSLWPGTVEEITAQLSRARRPVIKTHSTPRLNRFSHEALELCKKLLASADVIYTVRDPRKVMPSYQLMIEGSPSKNAADFERFITSPLPCGRTPLGRWKEHIEEWRDLGCAKIVKYEAIVVDPQRVVEEIGEFVGLAPLPIKKRLPRKIHSPWERRWMRLFQWNPESTAILARGRNAQYRPIKWEEFATEQVEELCAAAETDLNLGPH